MSDFIIKKGNHRTSFPYQIPWLTFRQVFEWDLSFKATAEYEVPEGFNQLDIHKLCGWTSLVGIHKESARYGFRFNIDKKCFQLMAYTYVNGESKHLPTTEIVIADLTCHCDKRLKLTVEKDCYRFNAFGNEVIIPKTHNHKVGMTCCIFFGDPKKYGAPHDMHISLTKLKNQNHG